MGDQTNQYVPSFISNSPWYCQSSSGSLSHQRKQTLPKPSIDTWYSKGVRLRTDHKKFRKGACSNCGALTHDLKTCCERPRKIGARYTGQDLQSDEVIQTVELDYDGKHDRWNGFVPEMFDEVVEEYAALEAVKKHKKLDEDLPGEYNFSQLESNIDPRTKTVTRNNRQRKDTAGYLHSLDHTVQDYDGKSRALKDLQVHPETHDAELYADSWVKVSGDMQQLNALEGFAQKLNAQGNDLHPLANPSQTEFLYKLYTQQNSEFREQKERELEAKYGKQEDFLKNE